MNKRFFFITVFVVMNAILFAGCSSKDINNTGIRIVGQDVVLYKEALMLADDEVETFFSNMPTMLQTQQDWKDISFKQIANSYYTLLRTPNHLYLVVFTKEGNYGDREEVVFSNLESEDMIKSVKKGDQLDLVIQADKNGDYHFLYTNWPGNPQISRHYFEDGNAYVIYYEDGIVSDILSFTL